MPTNSTETPINQQLLDESNQLSSFELCYHSQELVQVLISRATDFTSHLRNVVAALLSADQNTYTQRRDKVEEYLKSVELNIQRLRAFFHVLNQRKIALDNNQDNTFESKTEASSNQSLDHLKKERDSLIEQVRNKNRYLKLAIDKTSDIIWQINAIQTLKQ